MTCREVQQEVATALLSGGELDALAAEHVAVCPLCAAEQASLRQVARVMAAASTDDVNRPLAPPAGDVLLQRILTAAADERVAHDRRARIGRILAAAAAVAVLVAGIAIGISLLAPDHTITASASTTGLSATADIERTAGGSELRIAVTGVPADTDCVVIVQTADGRSVPIAAWRAEYSGTAHVVGQVDVAPESITHVSITQSSGNVLLDIPVTA